MSALLGIGFGDEMQGKRPFKTILLAVTVR
jgi:hypothetical protein